LLGPKANQNDIRSVESIMKKISTDPDANAALADARETLGKQGVNL
jgi:hypothetical protein